MFRDFSNNNNGRYRRSSQTIEIPRRNGVRQQPRDLREAYWLLQQEHEKANAEKAALYQEAQAWQSRAKKLEFQLNQRLAAGTERQAEKTARLEQKLQMAQGRIADLEAEAAAAQSATEAEEWQEKFSRLSADFENSKKRLERRFSLESEREKEQILRDMLPLADNLERALSHSANPADDSGTLLTLKAFNQAMGQYGVQVINDKGETFNPEWHEAVGSVTLPGVKPGTIVGVEAKGYRLNGNLLRPAKVVVQQENEL